MSAFGDSSSGSGSGSGTGARAGSIVVRRYGDTVLHVGVVERAVEKRVAHDAGHNRHGASPAG